MTEQRCLFCGGDDAPGHPCDGKQGHREAAEPEFDPTTAFAPEPPRASPAWATLEARFRTFHADNPHVFDGLARFALEAHRAGRRRFSIEMLFGRLRWYSRIETTGDVYKLNNNHAAFYARLLIATYPELDGLFEFRRSYADDADLAPTATR